MAVGHAQKTAVARAPEPERPLAGYAVLTGLYAALASGFSAWLRASDHELPERMAPADFVLMSVATHKTARMIAKDRVTGSVRAPFTTFAEDGIGPGEVSETPRGRGLRRAIGELLVCPHCLGLWIATAFAVGLVVAPRPTRWAASVLTVLFGSDVLQIAYRKAAA